MTRLPKDALKQIREAEEQAALLCRVAVGRAAEMRESVIAQGEALCAEVRAETEADCAAALEEMRRRAALLEEKKRGEALAEAQAMTETARERIAEAVGLIVWEIIERCQ